MFEVQRIIFIDPVVLKDMVKAIIFRLPEKVLPIIRETIQGYFVVNQVRVDFFLLVKGLEDVAFKEVRPLI